MRVMIWADMEGVAGIHTWEHVGGSLPLYEEGRRLYTGEVNAAVRGCKQGGATEIVVIDGHGGGYTGGRGFSSLLPEELEPGASYVLGHAWARYIEPLEQGCDAVLFVGAHARAGTVDGVLSHTISSETWLGAAINGVPVGESGIIAAIAGSFGVPAIFVSGDEATCREVRELVGETVTAVAVKRGLGRYSAAHLAAREARERIEAGVVHALRERHRWPAPLSFAPPVTFEVELRNPDQAAPFYGRAGVEVIDARRVRATGGTFWEAWDRLWYRY